MILLRDEPTQELFEEVVGQFRLAEAGSHGPMHWERVAQYGEELVKHTRGADGEVVRLFALLHDARRLDEWEDPGHGERGALYAKQLAEHGGPLEHLTLGQRRTLYLAIRDHNKGKTSRNSTIGCCWDADRMDLPRVGLIPDERYMSTEHGKKLVRLMFKGDTVRDIDYLPRLTS